MPIRSAYSRSWRKRQQCLGGVMPESRSVQKKHLIFIAGGLVVAVLVIVFSFFWPPASVEQTQGAIGKRDVYRDQAPATAQSAPTTDADIAKQTEEFNKLMAIGQFKSTLSNPRFKNLASNPDFVKLMANANFIQLIANKSFAQAASSGALS